VAEPLRDVDINADAGEGYDDQQLVPHVTSLNIACGGHAGDELSMRLTLELAAAAGLRAGAHPSYPDRKGFGRRAVAMSREALAGSIEEQVSTLAGLAATAGIPVTHVKPHGALYNELWDDLELAALVAAAAARALPRARLVLPAGSVSLSLPLPAPPLAEVFLDRGYAADGHILARDQPGALVTDPRQLENQFERLASLEFQTMCVHGDNAAAPALLRAADAILARHGLRATAYTPA
jgi:UPF0271 protein